MKKQDLLKALEQMQDGYLSNITFPLAMDFIRNAGKYDFFINDFTGDKKALYIQLYNADGKFFDNHLWGFYSTKEIAKIFYNIIKAI